MHATSDLLGNRPAGPGVEDAPGKDQTDRLGSLGRRVRRHLDESCRGGDNPFACSLRFTLKEEYTCGQVNSRTLV
jgi:hypothetical protein